MATFADRLKLALEKRGWSQNRLEAEANLGRGRVNKLLKSKGARTDPEVLGLLAGTLGISYEWLASGRGEMEAGAPPVLPPPRALPSQPLAPISMGTALDGAFDSTRHKISDALAVRDLLAGGLTLSRPLEVHGLARALLDAAASLREQGVSMSKDALLETLALRIVQLTGGNEENDSFRGGKRPPSQPGPMTKAAG